MTQFRLADDFVALFPEAMIGLVFVTAINNKIHGEECAEILARQSATVAVGLRASAIEALLAIRRAYPHVPVPLDIKPAEVRRAV